jgi:hypothetical protein
MPGYDRTGPRGQGPGTGGGFGFCAARTLDSGSDARGYGRGFRPGGRGMQRGFRRGFCLLNRGRNAARYALRWSAETTRPDPAMPDLEAEAARLRRRLDAIERRLAGMQGPGAEPQNA